MRIKVKQSELFKGISIVQKAVSKNHIIPELNSILFVAEGNELKLTGNNYIIGIETCINAEVLESGNVIIKGDLIEKIIRKIQEEYVEIVVDDRFGVEIKSCNLDIKIYGRAPINLIKLEDIEEVRTITVTEYNLKYMINQTVLAVFKNSDSETQIAGELIKLENNEVFMVACDTYRLAFKKHIYKGNLNTNIEIIISRESLLELETLLSKNSKSEVEITLGNDSVLFKIGKIKFLTKTIEADFIDYKYFISMKISAEMRMKKEELINALELTYIFCPKQSYGVRFSAIENKLILSINSDEGSIVKIIDVKYNGKEIKSAFNVIYFLEALRTINEEYINFVFYDDKYTSGGIQIVDSDEYQYKVLPMRLHN